MKKYFWHQYYGTNTFKFLLPESRVNASLHTYCHPCYCHPCYQPKVARMTRCNRVDTHAQMIAISVPEYNFHVTKENTFFLIPVNTCHPCYFWLVTGMTKSMQTRIYYAFWKQKLKYVYTVLLRPMIPFQCLDIIFNFSILFF